MCKTCSGKIREVADRISAFSSNAFLFITVQCTNFFKSFGSAVYELFESCFVLSVESMRTKIALSREQLQKMQQTPIENVDYSFINDLSSLAKKVEFLIDSVKTRPPAEESEELDSISKEAFVIKEAISSLVMDLHEKLKENRPAGIDKTELECDLAATFWRIVIAKDPDFFRAKKQ